MTSLGKAPAVCQRAHVEMIHSCLFKDAGEAALYLQYKWLETYSQNVTLIQGLSQEQWF